MTEPEPPPPSSGQPGAAGGAAAATPAADLAVAAPLPRRRRPVLWAAVIVAAPVLGLVGVLAFRPPAGSRAADSPLIGKPAPAVEGATVDGGAFRLGDLRGRWVVLNFFATWCVPCRQEHPELIRFDERHRQAGDAQVVAVVYNDSSKAVREFRDQEGGAWPMVVDPKGRIALDYGVAGVPESYLVDPRGVVAAKIVGGVRADDLERLLARVKQASPDPRERSRP